MAEARHCTRVAVYRLELGTMVGCVVYIGRGIRLGRERRGGLFSLGGVAWCG